MNFRRVITALAVLALFAGLASAQVINPSPITCSVSAATSPSVRSEGTTERVGDVFITCTSGPSLTDATAADRATISVKFGGATITSRTDAALTTNTKDKPSEILLLIDEPNTVSTANAAVAGFGQNAPNSVCALTDSNIATPGNCPAFKNTINNFYVITTTAAAPFTPAANTYQGSVRTDATDTVKFYNVPVVAPGPNATRTYRVANVRLTAGSSPIVATVTVTPAANAQTQISLGSSNTATVATPANSLSATVSPVGGVSLCVSSQPSGSALGANAKLALLTFKENFNNAFKVRALPIVGNVAGESLGTGQQAGGPQNASNGTYGTGNSQLTTALSESGVVVPAVTVASVPAGLADSGTRFKAVFTGLPSSSTAKFYVSQTNVIDYNTAASITGGFGQNQNVPYAILIGQGASAETAAEPVALPGAADATSGTNNLTQLSVSSGKAEVVWELTNTTKNAANTVQFALYVVYSNITSVPTVGNTATVQLGYAPTDTNPTTAMTWIPRFNAPTATAATFFNVLPCQTSLLFPFVTTSAAFETGLAISNTSADPYTTQTSHGTCNLNFYGTGYTAASQLVTPDVPAGTSYVNVASALVGPNFTGYMVATCNFQFAHGFAFIQSGTGSSQMAMGYVASVLNGTTRGQSLIGEALSQ